MPTSLPFELENEKTNQIIKIGKLRLMKSGKVVLRLHTGNDNASYIDLDVSMGIQPAFYQELVTIT